MDGGGGTVGTGAGHGTSGSDGVVVAVAMVLVVGGVGGSLRGGAISGTIGSRIVVGIGSGHPHSQRQVQVV